MRVALLLVIALTACASESGPRSTSQNDRKALCNHFANMSADDSSTSFVTSDVEAYCR